MSEMQAVLQSIYQELADLRRQLAEHVLHEVPGNFTPGRMLYGASDGTVAESGSLLYTDGTNLAVTAVDVPGGTVDVSNLGLNQATAIEVGARATGNRYAFVDLHGDDTYTDFAARFIRGNGGPNSSTSISHRGTGPLGMDVVDNGSFNVSIASVAKLTIAGATNIWVAPTLTNGWIDYGGGFTLSGYTIDAAGIVHLRGLVKSGTIGAAIFTLPVGYRPPSTTYIYSVASNSAYGEIRVNSVGSVYLATGSNVWCSMDGISFSSF